jgi:hypothetical protein
MPLSTPCALFAIVAVCVATYAGAQTSEVRVDDSHMQIGDQAREKRVYTVPTGPSFVLDLGTYRFSLWPESEPAPDTISIIVSEQHKYYLPLVAGQTRYLVPGQSLTAGAAKLPFVGFKSGQRIMIAIGKRRYDIAKREDILRVHWLGMVEVR